MSNHQANFFFLQEHQSFDNLKSTAQNTFLSRQTQTRRAVGEDAEEKKTITGIAFLSPMKNTRKKIHKSLSPTLPRNLKYSYRMAIYILGFPYYLPNDRVS